MLIRLDSLRGEKKKKKTLALHTMPSASLNPTREAEVLSRWGGGSCTGPAPAGENPPALLWGGERKSIFPAEIGCKTGGWGQRADKILHPALGSALRGCDAAASKPCASSRDPLGTPNLKLGSSQGRL